MSIIEVQVPDIGDFDEVGVIEVLVKAGDTVKVEQSLITVESDKASMEIPSSAAGVVKELRVKIGDKVAKGSVVLTLESADAAAPAPAAAAPANAAPAPAPAAAAPAPAAATYSGNADQAFDLVVLGGGPGGYSAAFRAADLGLKVALVERYATLGGVCLNVGCIPSKALLHVAAVMDDVSHMADLGVAFGEPEVDIAKLRAHKNKVTGKLTGGLAAMAKMRKVTVLRGVGTLLDAQHLKVEATEGAVGQAKTGAAQTVAFKRVVIAAGSQAVRLPFLPNDPRIVDSTGALEMDVKPQKMLIVGGGIIGLEMGTVYSTLGARLDVVEMLPTLMTGADRDLVKVWQKFNAHRFDNILLNTKTVGAEAKPDGIWVTFEGEGAPKEPQRYDLVLQAVGRTPNGKKIGAENAGRHRRRPRLHPGRRADAHQRAQRVRHRRHRRPAHAGPQGGARRPRGGGSHRRRTAGRRQAQEEPVRRPRDPERGLHRSRGRVGGHHRGRSEGQGHQGHQGPVPVDGFRPCDCQRPRRRLHQAAVRRGKATASSAAASSARMPAT